MKWVLVCCVVIAACNNSGTGSGLSRAELDSFVWRMNDKISYELYEQPTLDPMRDYLTSIEDTVRKLNYDKLTFYWTLSKAQYFNYYQNYDTINSLMKDVVRLAKSPDISQKDRLNFYIIYNGILKQQGLTDSALKIANNAYFLAREIDTNRLAQTSLDLARIYQQLDDLQNFRKYIFEAWKHSNQEPELKTFIFSGISYYYDRKNEYDSALYFFKQSEKDSFLVMKPQDYADNYMNEAIFLIKKGKLNEGFQLQLKAKGIYDSLGIKDPLTYFNLSESYGTLKQFDKSIAYIDSARFLAEQSNNYNLIRLSWYNKAAQYAKIPDYKKAHEALDSAYERFSIEIDSSLREQARDLEAKYSVREKDNRIKALAITNEANLKIRKQQQFVIISMSIAAMLLTFVGILLWRRRRTQMLLREANLKQQLLRAQMDPHFLFNSLSILQNLIRTGHTEKAISYLNTLTRLMQFNFKNASENFVMLKDEIHALESYLKLQELYHPGLFTYQITLNNIAEEENLYIPPMLLQPFVENAIHHGFSQIDYIGKLTITIEKKQYNLECIIDDNGKGILNVPGTERIRSTGINQERLSILAKQTGIPAKLEVIDKKTINEGTGTQVRIEIPFRNNKINS